MRMTAEQIDKVIELMDRAKAEYKNRVPSFNEVAFRSFLEESTWNPKMLVLTNKDVTAILALMVMPHPFTHTQLIKDIVWYSETAGAGVRLLKEAKIWVDEWGDSVFDAYLSTSMNDEKVDEMIQRIGLTKVGSQFSFKGVSK